MTLMSITPSPEVQSLGAQLAIAYRNVQASYTFESQQHVYQLELAMTKHRKTCLRYTWIYGQQNIQITIDA